ncbi:Atp-binding protein [Globisporangium polare]
MTEVQVIPQSILTNLRASNVIAVVPVVTGECSSSAERRPPTSAVLSFTTNVIFRAYSPSKWDIWMLGITIVIGGQYFSWNAGLAAGLYSYLSAYFLIASAYITLCCCTSEVTGALPFAGGAYGLSRCTLGFFPGYLIGCCDALEYIAYVATSVVSLAKMIIEAAPVL